MLKRNFKVIATLALSLSLSAGFVTAHAANLSSAESSTSKKIEQKICKQKRHGGSISSVLKNKLGFTDSQIEEAKKSGKTAFDLAKEKGVNPDQFRTMIIETKSQKIDELVKENKITKEKADTMKTHLKDRIQKWDGCFNHDEHKIGRLNPILKNKLGLTDSQIEEAQKSGKTAFELAKEKGVTQDQLRSMIIDAKSQKIDELFKEGRITKEQSDTIKARIKDKIQKWDGHFEQKEDCKR